MKLIFDLNIGALPDAFKADDPAGLQNLLSFLHENLVCRQLEKATSEAVLAPYQKAFYDQQGLDGQAWVDAIRQTNDDNIAIGKLLMDSLKVER